VTGVFVDEVSDMLYVDLSSEEILARSRRVGGWGMVQGGVASR